MNRRRLKSLVHGILLAFLLLGQSLAVAETDRSLDSVEEVLQSISRLRNMEALEPIKKGLRSREEIRAYLIAKVQEEYAPEEIEAEAAFLKHLGLIPLDMDLYEFMINLLTEQIAGYYDHEIDTFFIADWIPVESQKPVMAHELMHALQDQHFDLKRFLEPVDGNDDETMARGAVIEGEGLIIMLDYMLEGMNQSSLAIPDIVQMNEAQKPLMMAEFPIFASAPPYLQDSVVFPYTYGANFIQALLKAGSWDTVTATYQKMPQSSEQILHPQKYLDGSDAPVSLETASLQPQSEDEWEPLYQNVMGEYGLFMYLRETVPVEEARKASEGWGGDAVELLRDAKGNRLFLLNSQWDTETDAVEFFEALAATVEKRFPAASRVDPGPGQPNEEVAEWRFGENYISIRQKGLSVIGTEQISN